MEDAATYKVKKEKSLFKMNTDWIYSDPIDLEHKQYVLMDFLKYCDKKIDKFEIYPVYTELSIHLANLQSISGEFKTLYFEKKLQNVDDEILLSDLKFKPVPITDEKEYDEFSEIVKFAGQKVLDYFNIVKAVWTIVYDSISLKVIKNEKNYEEFQGYFYYDKDGKRMVWKYQIENRGRLTIDSKMNIILVKTIEIGDDNIIEYFDFQKRLPIFEVTTTMDYPMQTSLIPAFKRKILNYTIQRNTILNLKRNGIK
jgi:hypothetical protein